MTGALMPEDLAESVDDAFGRRIVPLVSSLLGALDEGKVAEEGEYSYFFEWHKEAAQVFSYSVAGGLISTAGKPIPPGEAGWTDGDYPWAPFSTNKPLAYPHVGSDGAQLVAADGYFPLVLFFGTDPYNLVVAHTTLVARPMSDRLQVTVSGVVALDLVKQQLSEALARVSAPCHLDQETATKIASFADAMADGSSQPDQPCDALSFGASLDFYRAMSGEATEDFAPATCAP